MTDPERAGPRDQLHEEAAFWFARMRGEAAETHRTAFEQWLARGALHRAAYNRIAEIFNGGKVLKSRRPSIAHGMARSRVLKGLGAVTVGLAALGIWIAQPSPLSPTRMVQPRHPTSGLRQLVTLLGERRRIVLTDGSTVLLDRDTLVTVAFSPDRRLLRLERGRARFDVAHEARPFQVRAADAVITAHGTIFDVALGVAPGVEIRLLRGAIGVRSPSFKSRSETLLRAGQSLTVTKAGGQVVDGVPDDDWAAGRRTFRQARLDAVLDAANRGAIRKIVLANPAMGAVRLSGTFRIDDTERLARQLAALLALDAEPTEDRISLRPRAGK